MYHGKCLNVDVYKSCYSYANKFLIINTYCKKNKTFCSQTKSTPASRPVIDTKHLTIEWAVGSCGAAGAREAHATLVRE